MSKRSVYLGMFVLAWGLAAPTSACTTFVLSDGDAVLFARNFDWNWGDGIIVINKRGLEKTAFVRPPETPARWTSKYGSVTFNQFGPDMPYGGINEVGLVVEMMMLMDSEYPDADQRPAVNLLQWIQYQLDNSRTVEEVLATNETVRIEAPQGDEKIHYLICDAAGDTATVEFLNGKLVYRRGDRLAAKALTNNTYRESIEFSAAFAASRGRRAVPAGPRSLHRFARAAKCSSEFKSRTPSLDREYAFNNLNDVAQSSTVWSIVYDISNRRVYYRTRDNPQTRWFALADFDYAPLAAPVYLDINASGEGHVSSAFDVLYPKRYQERLLHFFGKPDVQEQFGDMKPYVLRLFATVSSYGLKVE